MCELVVMSYFHYFKSSIFIVVGFGVSGVEIPVKLGDCDRHSRRLTPLLQ